MRKQKKATARSRPPTQIKGRAAGVAAARADATKVAFKMLMDATSGKTGWTEVKPDAPPTPPKARLIEGDSAYRKAFPVTSGLIDYFPDACAAVSEVSYLGNLKHNPGQIMHHARGKSMDHADCIGRHLMERGGFDTIVVEGVTYRIRHTAALAWRAFALLQEELENELALPLPRGARA